MRVVPVTEYETAILHEAVDELRDWISSIQDEFGPELVQADKVSDSLDTIDAIAKRARYESVLMPDRRQHE